MEGEIAEVFGGWSLYASKRGQRQRGLDVVAPDPRVSHLAQAGQPDVVVDEIDVQLLATLRAHGRDLFPDLDWFEIPVLVRDERGVIGTADRLVERDPGHVDYERAGLRDRADRVGKPWPEPVADVQPRHQRVDTGRAGHPDG